MDSALEAALVAFDRDDVRGEHVVRAERAIPLDGVIELFHRLDPSSDPFRAPGPKLDAQERLEVAAELDGMLGESPWGLAINAVADAYVLADWPERAFELRLRALGGILSSQRISSLGWVATCERWGAMTTRRSSTNARRSSVPRAWASSRRSPTRG